MDTLLPIINFFRVNRFWLTCFVLAGAMIGVWFMASGELTTAMNQAKSGIEQKVTAANGIISTTAVDVGDGIVAHPNDATIKGMTAELDKGTQAVLDAWKLRYDAQKELMTWPEEVTKSKEFVEYFSQFRPFETFPETRKGTTMRELLQVYHQQIPGRMDAICDIIGTKWKFSEKEAEENKKAQDESGANKNDKGGGEQANRGDPRDRGAPKGGARPPRGGGDDRSRSGLQANATADDSKDVVKWDEKNQELWFSKLTNFKGFDDNDLPWNLPTPLQIYTLQQDLWLLEAMFNIIKTVNGDADANDLAKVKRIDHVVFGREARAQLGTIREPQQGLAAEQATGAATGSSAGGLQGDKRGAGARRMERNQRLAQGSDDPFAAVPDPTNSPFHGRYVDVNFAPIKAEDVRNVYKGTELPDKYLELIVAKRVPVRIAVRMDERYIPEFLAACSKSAFAFEVNQVRINRHVAGDEIVRVGGSMGAGGSSSAEKGGRPDRGAGIGAGGGAGGGTGLIGDGQAKQSGGDESDVDVEVRTNFDVDVEFYGVVKIYNPVNRALLTGEKDPVAEQTAPAQPAPSSRP